MKRLPNYHQLKKAQRLFYKLGVTLLIMLILLAACSPRIETETVEVTRVVTQTVTVEGETVEVTRVVTEIVVETIEVEPEGETVEEPPSATGREGDAGPLPPPPGNGPKVAESRGSTPPVDLALETAVSLRANQINSTPTTQFSLLTTPVTINPADMQKWCRLAAKVYKKWCA